MSLDILISGISLAWQAWETFEKINDAPDEVARVANSIKTMKTYMEEVKRIIEKHRLSLAPSQIAIIKENVNSANQVSEDARDLFDKWGNEKGAAPFGLRWRHRRVGQIIFTTGSSMDALKELEGEAKSRCEELNRTLGIIQADNLLGMQTKLLGPPSPGPKTGHSSPEGKWHRSPSPSPMPKTSDIRILFVDPSNQGRSRVAEALTLLIGTWTVCAGEKWKISTASSAGYFIREKSDVIDMVSNMKLLYPNDVAITQGGNTAAEVAMDALFDNGSYNHPLKKRIKEKIVAEKSRGLRSDLFRKFDYILVFTKREHENLIRLKIELMAKNGAKAAPEGKGKILHLGQYLKEEGKPIEIYDPRATRENWNAKVGQIKFALKQFLQKELGWKQWTPGTKLERWEEVIKWAV